MPGRTLPPNGTLKPVTTLSQDFERSTVMSTLDGHFDVDVERLAAVAPVVVEPAVGLPRAVGHGLDLRAHHPLAVVEELLDGGEHRVAAVLSSSPRKRFSPRRPAAIIASVSPTT